MDENTPGINDPAPIFDERTLNLQRAKLRGARVEAIDDPQRPGQSLYIGYSSRKAVAPNFPVRTEAEAWDSLFESMALAKAGELAMTSCEFGAVQLGMLPSEARRPYVPLTRSLRLEIRQMGVNDFQVFEIESLRAPTRDAIDSAQRRHGSPGEPYTFARLGEAAEYAGAIVERSQIAQRARAALPTADAGAPVGGQDTLETELDLQDQIFAHERPALIREAKERGGDVARLSALPGRPETGSFIGFAASNERVPTTGEHATEEAAWDALLQNMALKKPGRLIRAEHCASTPLGTAPSVAGDKRVPVSRKLRLEIRQLAQDQFQIVSVESIHSPGRVPRDRAQQTLAHEHDLAAADSRVSKFIASYRGADQDDREEAAAAQRINDTPHR